MTKRKNIKSPEVAAVFDAYPKEVRSGSLVRIDQIKSREGKYAMYFHCQRHWLTPLKKCIEVNLSSEETEAGLRKITEAIAINKVLFLRLSTVLMPRQLKYTRSAPSSI